MSGVGGSPTFSGSGGQILFFWTTTSSAGIAGNGYGSGGSGGASTANASVAGGAGASGLVIVTEYK